MNTGNSRDRGWYGQHIISPSLRERVQTSVAADLNNNRNILLFHALSLSLSQLPSFHEPRPQNADVLSVVPDSRILIETDRQVPAAAADKLLRVCGAIAEAKGISVVEAGALANRNAARFLAEL